MGVAVEPCKVIVQKTVDSRVIKLLHMWLIGKTREVDAAILSQSSQEEVSLIEKVLSWLRDGSSTTRAVRSMACHLEREIGSSMSARETWSAQ